MKLHLLAKIVVGAVIVYVIYQAGLHGYKRWNASRLQAEISERLQTPREERHAIMKELYDIVSNISTITSTKPFLIYGSLLGQQRSDDFICWDYDLDYGIMLDEYSQFLQKAQEMVANLKEYKLNLHTIFDLLNIKMFQIVHIRTGINADISAFKHDKSNDTIHRNVLKLYSSKVLGEPIVDFPAQTFLPLQKIMFKDQAVYIPNQPHKYLECMYGKRWYIPDKKCTCDFCINLLMTRSLKK